MDIQKILFSFQGRIGRSTYWLSILALIVGVQVLTTAILVFEGFDGEDAEALKAVLASQLIWLASLWPILAIGSKRLHDRDKRGWWLLLLWFLPLALFFAGFFTGWSGNSHAGSILMLASLPFALWGLVELGILPGTKGPNRFGIDPALQAT